MKKKLKVLNQKPILSPHQYLFASHLLPRIPFWEFKNKKLCLFLRQFLSIQLFLNFEFSSWIITSSSPFHERKIKWNFYPIIFAELHLVLSRNNSGLTSRNSHRWNVTRPIYELKKIPRNDRWSVVKFRKKKRENMDWNFSIRFHFSSKRKASKRRPRWTLRGWSISPEIEIRIDRSTFSPRQWDRMMARNTVVIINLPSILVHAEQGYEIFIFIYEECTRPYWFFDVNAAASLFERAPFQLFTRFHRRTKRA